MNSEVRNLVERQNDWLVDLRRYFHAHPEISGQEYNTQKKVMAELVKLGLQPRSIAGTGVIADVIGRKAGKTVAIRADMDALQLDDQCEREYKSQNPGISHACGHDGHVAMLLGVARVLVALQGKICGTVRLLFQPSEEELPGGALALIQEGALEGVCSIIGSHLWQPLAVGTMGITYGRMMASPDEFVITIKGRGGHGAMPQQAADALLVGAQLVTALHTIVSRNIDPVEAAVLSLGVFKAGDMPNIIPDTALLKGTVRSFEHKVRLRIFQRIEQITQGLCAAAGTDYKMEKMFGFPPVVNHPEIAKIVAESGREVLGSDGVLLIDPVMAGEDFSYYQEKVPGAFLFIGVGSQDKGITYPHHHPKFDIDESALSKGVAIMVHAALKLLS